MKKKLVRKALELIRRLADPPKESDEDEELDTEKEEEEDEEEKGMAGGRRGRRGGLGVVSLGQVRAAEGSKGREGEEVGSWEKSGREGTEWRRGIGSCGKQCGCAGNGGEGDGGGMLEEGKACEGNTWDGGGKGLPRLLHLLQRLPPLCRHCSCCCCAHHSCFPYRFCC